MGFGIAVLGAGIFATEGRIFSPSITQYAVSDVQKSICQQFDP